MAAVLGLLWPREAGAATGIELVTMGTGDDPFSLFGHAAICVLDTRSKHQPTCYNYGTTDFSRPAALALDFLRGDALFWVSIAPRAGMVRAYAAQDRSVYVQQLPWSAEQVRTTAEILARDAEPAQGTYQYRHFDDNCTTRLRDIIDRTSGGALQRATQEPYDRTLRDIVREGFRGHLGLLVASELLLGRAVDRHPSKWEAMFLPSVLRQEVSKLTGARARVVHARKAPLSSGNGMGGRNVLLAASAGVAIVLGPGMVRERGLAGHVSRILAAIVLGGVGIALGALVVVSSVPELRANELLLVLWPTDLALAILRGRSLAWYALVRATVLAVVAVAALAGWLVQPLFAPWLGLFALFSALAAVKARHLRAGAGSRSLRSL